MNIKRCNRNTLLSNILQGNIFYISITILFYLANLQRVINMNIKMLYHILKQIMISLLIVLRVLSQLMVQILIQLIHLVPMLYQTELYAYLPSIFK